MEEKLIGRVERYFSKIGVAAIRITAGELKIDDKISIKGHTTDFEQVVESIQVEHMNVESAKTGDDIGIKTKERVREGDTVYLIIQ
jgi:translation elongation factor EF-1alpha